MYEGFVIGTSKIIAPNLTFLPFKYMSGVKRFHLIAEEVQQPLDSNVTIRAWGYNGSTPGPVILVTEGDRVQIQLENRLPQATSIHWHGLIVPDSVDGVPGIGAGPIVEPGETYVYDFTIHQAGTYMYHSHASPEQEMMGMAGMIVSLPRTMSLADREYLILLQEWSVQMGSMRDTYEIDPKSMDFNYFTLNGKSYPATQALNVRLGESIKIRLANLSMHSHPMHLHGHDYRVIEADGVPLPVPFFKNTLNVAPGETWDIEFIANNPGKWAFHCHKPHHMTNMHGTSTGGMFTIINYI